MNVAGIDVSTRTVHVCLLDFDSDEARVYDYDASDCGGDALVRARTLADLLPHRRSTLWDDVGLVAIERPMGPGTRQVGDMMIVVGVVIAHLPVSVPVWLLGPTEWRKACGLSGKASKADVAAFVGRGWAQDACDAYCVAYAAREINGRGVEAAA